VARKKIAIIGVGKISQDQHLPVIDKSKDFVVAATVSTRGLGHNDVPVFKTPAELYKAMPDVKLVAICTPPGVRPVTQPTALRRPMRPASDLRRSLSPAAAAPGSPGCRRRWCPSRGRRRAA